MLCYYYYLINQSLLGGTQKYAFKIGSPHDSHAQYSVRTYKLETHLFGIPGHKENIGGRQVSHSR